MKIDQISRRRGKFFVSMDAIDDFARKHLPELWQNFVVVDARANYMSRTVEYCAYSPLFDEISYGEIVPTYDIVISKNRCPQTGVDVVEVSARKLDVS